jgi:hypothetical protein
MATPQPVQEDSVSPLAGFFSTMLTWAFIALAAILVAGGLVLLFNPSFYSLHRFAFAIPPYYEITATPTLMLPTATPTPTAMPEPTATPVPPRPLTYDNSDKAAEYRDHASSNIACWKEVLSRGYDLSASLHAYGSPTFQQKDKTFTDLYWKNVTTVRGCTDDLMGLWPPGPYDGSNPLLDSQARLALGAMATTRWWTEVRLFYEDTQSIHAMPDDALWLAAGQELNWAMTGININAMTGGQK